jgi:putative pre-16S rRNA nuclease
MRIMALDVGDKKIGLAVSDEMLLTAQPRPTLKRTNLNSDVEQLRKLAEKNEVKEIIVGNPLHMDGRPSAQSQKVARFARKLHEATRIPVTFWDERLTSFAAEQHLEEMGLNWRKRREHVDQVAAMLILQSYLDGRRSG